VVVKLRFRNVESFRKELDNKLSRATEQAFQADQEEMLRDLKAETPVATGEARDSWYLQDPGFLGLSYSLLSGTNELKSGLKNSASHIVYLNWGHSKQAPRYFIESVLSDHGKLD